MMFQAKYRYLYITLLGAYSFFNIKFTDTDAFFDFQIAEWLIFFFIMLFVIGIWEGNLLLHRSLKKIKFDHKEYALLISHFLLSLLVVGFVSVLGFFSIPLFLDLPENTSTLRLMIAFNFRINLFLHIVNAIVFYRSRVSKYQVEAERFKKESAEAQFDALRNQVNPHFLFNSFNVLSNLVYSDPDKASHFIQGLSQVYRYLLKNKNNKLVKLEEELRFLDAYEYLMKTRFQDNLNIDRSISENSKTRYLPPAALQLLIENAVKHNEVSKKSPLFISVYNQNGHLVVENNIQPKEEKEESSKVGLENIRKRYSFLSEEHPVIVNVNGKFSVKLPLIEVES